MKLNYKSVQLEYKKEKEDENFLYIDGMVSPYNGKPDLGGDIVEKGAFKRTLDQKGNSRVMLYQHKHDQPIGTINLKDTNEGLIAEDGMIAKKLFWGKEASNLIEMGIIKGLSIGYRTIKSDRKGDYTSLKELALYEVSVVTFPMNENSNVTAFKNDCSFAEQLELVLSSIDQAKLTDIDIIKKSVATFNNLLSQFITSDPKNSPDDEEVKRLVREKERKLVLDFKNFISEKMK